MKECCHLVGLDFRNQVVSEEQSLDEMPDSCIPNLVCVRNEAHFLIKHPCVDHGPRRMPKIICQTKGMGSAYLSETNIRTDQNDDSTVTCLIQGSVTSNSSDKNQDFHN